MKAIAFLLIAGALLFCSATAFAFSIPDQLASLFKKSSTVPTISSTVKQPLNQWVGKPLSQLIQTYGEPNYTSVMKNGRFVYDFVREPQHVGPIPTYQFIVGRNKTITTARLIL